MIAYGRRKRSGVGWRHWDDRYESKQMKKRARAEHKKYLREENG